ncbi:MAG: MarR family transcriptional regulator [Actinomycetota bacterium]|nr:MarR family transcriptional regulator [Actinomycetota bacterium]
MPAQLERESPLLQSWVSFLRAHAAAIRQANADLIAAHGLTLNDYEVLLRLARADDRRLRRVDLVNQVLLTPSGITRLLNGLEKAGYVDRAQCESDARVTYAVLTNAGYEKLREAGPTHLESIHVLFGERFNEEELETLGSLLGRLSGGPDSEECLPE